MNRALPLCAILLAGCSGTKDEERVLPPEPATLPPAPVAPPPPTMPAPTLAELGCEGLVPSTMRDLYLGGATLTADLNSTTTRLICAATGIHAPIVIASCPDALATVDEATKAFKAAHPDALAVSDLGRAAILVQTPKTKTIAAWDDDSPCEIELTVPASSEVIALAKDLLAALPPKAPPGPAAEAPAAGSADAGSAQP